MIKRLEIKLLKDKWDILSNDYPIVKSVNNIFITEKFIIKIEDDNERIIVIPICFETEPQVSIHKISCREFYLQEGSLFLGDKNDILYSFMRPKNLQVILDKIDCIKINEINNKTSISIDPKEVIYYQGFNLINNKFIIDNKTDKDGLKTIPLIIKKKEESNTEVYINFIYNFFVLEDEVFDKINERRKGYDL